MPIERNIRFESVGTTTSVSNAYYNNYFADSTPVKTTFIDFNIPGYYTYGGTLNYYGQDPFSIFTNLLNPPIRFKFTGNTGSLSGESYFIHDIFRLPYDTHKLFSTNQITNSLMVSNKIGTADSHAISSDNLNNTLPPTDTFNTRTSENASKVVLGSNVGPTPDALFGQALNSSDISTIQTYFSNPLVTITASTSAITGTVYDLLLEEFAKKLGNYKVQLLEDKAQYILRTTMVFPLSLNKDYKDFSQLETIVTVTGITATTEVTQNTAPLTIDGRFKNEFSTILEKAGITNLVNVNISFTVEEKTIITGETTGYTSVVSESVWNDTFNVVSTQPEHTITGGTYSGVTVAGNFFTYFIVPDKPLVEYPVTQGQLSTFTPEFRWSNGGNADSFIVQINYNTGDTSFTGTVLNYPVEKSEKNRFTANSTTKSSSEEFSTNKDIYNFQVPVKSNKCFLWRVGNSKEVVNIFDVRQNVVTFSDYYSACSQPEPVKTYVVSEVDSPHVSEVAGFGVPPSLDYEDPIAEYTLSGTVSGSTIVGANMTLLYPNLSFANTTTDSQGQYVFDNLEPGNYTLTTVYRGYQTDVRPIVINSNMVENFRIHLLWGDSADTWGDLAGDLFS